MIQQPAGVREFEHLQPRCIHVDQAAVDGENLHAIASAFGDPPVEFLRLAQSLFAALARGDVGVGAGHADGGAALVSDYGTTCEEPPDAPVAMHHPMLDLVNRSLT